MSWKDKVRAIRDAAADTFRWTMKKLGWDAEDFDEMTDAVEFAAKAWATRKGLPPALVDGALTAFFNHLDAGAAGILAEREGKAK